LVGVVTAKPAEALTSAEWIPDTRARVLRVAWRWLLVALVAYAATTVPGVRHHQGFNSWIDGWLQNGILVAATLLIGVRALLVRRERFGWAFVAVGIGLYAVGNSLYFAWVQFQDPLPLPSVADAAWLASYGFLYIGLVSLARPRVAVSKGTPWLDGIVGALAFGAAASLWLQVVLSRSEGPGIAVVTTMAYPVGDLALIVVVIGTCGLLGWRPDRGWLYLGGGLALFAAADTIYTVRVATDSYVAGTLLDPMWAVAAVLIATAALHPPQVPREVRPHGWSMLVTPSVCVLAALSLIVFGTWHRISTLSVALATLTVVAGLIRAAITFRDVQLLSVNKEQARTDELTGLGNRRRFYEVVGARLAARSEGDQLCVLLLDLDRFKEVNDALGHSVGDLLLRQVGERLSTHLRQSDELVRLGGDEFAIMLGSTSPGDARGLSERLRTTLQSPFVFDGMSVYVDASVGIAGCPEAATTVEGLLQRADIAMYQAKTDGLGTVVYRAEKDDLAQRLRGISELRRAIDERQLVLHYQPKVDLSTGQMVGVEALVRWEHPELGLLQPAAFLPEAERCGLMRPLTRTVLAMALDQVREWRTTGGPSHVAVNVTVSNLLDTELPKQIQSMLEVRGLPGEALTAEITEGTLMVDPPRALRVLNQLRELGVCVSIDDYGTGYSSLARLRDMPVTELKLDRSFVQQIDEDERAAAIVESTIRLAHSLGLTLVAEGVESACVQDRLVAMGCDVAQGYHLGRPAPASAFLTKHRVPSPAQPGDELIRSRRAE
jgi:diguanylate cyclase (GGDEF)-like protein